MICIATVTDPFDWCFPQDDYDSYDSDYPYPQSYLPHVQGGISMVRSTTHFCTTFELMVTNLMYTRTHSHAFFYHNRRCDGYPSPSPMPNPDPQDVHANINFCLSQISLLYCCLLMKIFMTELDIKRKENVYIDTWQ